MPKIRVYTDLKECEQIWRELWPENCLFDRWDIRLAFHRHFQRPIHFVVAESFGRQVGLLPLSWIEEEGYYGCFPGETWNSKTWLEQNRIPAESEEIRQLLWAAAPDNTRLRYLLPEECPADAQMDEIGYLFHPLKYNSHMDAYWAEFSGKSKKQLQREAGRFDHLGCRYQENQFDDIPWMFEQNLMNFGPKSYFHDSRFRNGFNAMLDRLREMGILRVVTVRVGGQTAAVDVGAVYRNQYTVLGGATDMAFTGIAKTINLLHLDWGCQNKIQEIDFLCGDFGWKPRFHLEARPLYIACKADESYLLKTRIRAEAVEA